MKNSYNKHKAINDLNYCLKNSVSYNEAIITFFENYICNWLEINASYIPTEPTIYTYSNDDGSKRILPRKNLLSNAIINFQKSKTK